ncbi:hypothetical protein CYMTET_45560 [Cymbomonas tetramitiformis]|uniref:Cyclic nucleotide-binding domain-containing protein n=1 Tax=Cymbomonas tetramitiformis TaxID=36881 RepID=A0AAE0BZR6_9CHLO|nr:hypothetical protein CYMTET_45560 [Cymbomonas tetramitiformis]
MHENPSGHGSPRDGNPLSGETQQQSEVETNAKLSLRLSKNLNGMRPRLSTLASVSPTLSLSAAISPAVKAYRISRSNSRHRIVSDGERDPPSVNIQNLMKATAGIDSVTWERQHGELLRLFEDPTGIEGSTLPQTWFGFIRVPLAPNSTFSNTWGSALKLAVLYVAVALPYTIGFEFEQGFGWILFDNFLDFFFMLDVFFSSITSFVDSRGHYITDLKVIRNNYFRSWFLIDLMASIPLELLYSLVLGGGPSMDISLLRFFKIPKLLRVTRLLKNQEYAHAFEVVRLFILLVLAIHWFACMWGFIKQIDDNSVVHLWGEEDTDLYLASIHYTFLGLLANTVSPRTNLDTAFAFFILASGVVANATVFATLVVAAQKMGARDAAYQEKVEGVAMWMKDIELPRNICAKISNHYDYMYRKYKHVDSHSYLDEFTPALRREVTQHLHLHFLKQVSLFTDCSEHLLATMCMHMKAFSSQPFDIVLALGERNTELFFVAKGVLWSTKIVDASIQVNLKDMHLLRKGDHFGGASVLLSAQSESNVQSLSYSDLYTLQATQLFEILKFHPATLRQMKWVALQRLHRPDDPMELEEGMTLEDTMRQLHGLVEKLPLFQKCEMDFVDSIAAMLRRLVLEPGSTVFNCGDEADCIYFIEQGAVEVYDQTTNHVTAELGPASIFGELAVIFHDTRSNTVKTKEKSTLYTLDQESLQKMMLLYPHSASVVADFAGERKLQMRREAVSNAIVGLMANDASLVKGKEMLELKYRGKWRKRLSTVAAPQDRTDEGNKMTMNSIAEQQLRMEDHEDPSVPSNVGDAERSCLPGQVA